ncbi:DNA-binding transcriptional MerR regulator [Mumia flava]|uniref:DNA-binding transcriptional MerR regulator n=1 Tax=Mumia flava TaxID=1348852 RepID=A0A0B2B6K7_9ACTN|nr:MerR family transcriptional regulator [Mumia flava]PJJ57702.1 DNA-binding transcriptional MerR regulator [Mumia flava]
MSEPVVSIGEFSRLTYLSIKTLRHYHDVGLLEPAAVDPSSGYRRYSLEQVSQAHLIRRLRDLEMPVPEVRTVLAASDADARDRAIRTHLARMEAQLASTRAVVASLRDLLAPLPALDVTFVDLPAQPVLVVRDVVEAHASARWYDDARLRLEATLDQSRLTATGPYGATWAHAFFENERGEVAAFAPVAFGGGLPARRSDPGVRLEELPAGRFATADHIGSLDDFDRTYGALGSHAIRHAAPLADPIREHYLHDRTEVQWPVRTQ